jgi:hypothetical protein
MYLLNYNINEYFSDILDNDRVLNGPEREQFWRMVEYRDQGKW